MLPSAPDVPGADPSACGSCKRTIMPRRSRGDRLEPWGPGHFLNARYLASIYFSNTLSPFWTLNSATRFLATPLAWNTILPP